MLTNISKSNNSQFHIYYVFNFYEEVHQASSFYLAKNNILNLNQQDFIVNLEANHIHNFSNPKHQIKKCNYEDGMILQISDLNCLYGYKSQGVNKAESLIKQITNEKNLEVQFGLTQGSCDARSFSNFDLTPNIVTLSVPNKYKHNEGDNGEIVMEEVYLKDIITMEETIGHILNFKEKIIVKDNIALKLKKNDYLTNQKAMDEKVSLNERLNIYYFPIIKEKRVFSENLTQKTLDLIFKIVSFLKFYLLKLF